MPPDRKHAPWVLLLCLLPSVRAAADDGTTALPAEFWHYLAAYADNKGHVFDPHDLAILLQIPPPGIALPATPHPAPSATETRP